MTRPSRRLPDGAVIASQDGTVLDLGETAASIWDLLTVPRTLDEMTELIEAEWPELERSEIAETVGQVVDVLVLAAAVTIDEAPRDH